MRGTSPWPPWTTLPRHGSRGGAVRPFTGLSTLRPSPSTSTGSSSTRCHSRCPSSTCRAAPRPGGWTVSRQTGTTASICRRLKYTTFKSTICGKINEKKFASYMGQDLYFPMVDSGCGYNVCLCYAHSDAFYDSSLELLCKKDSEERFMGQWGQDEFLARNVFRAEERRGTGIYVDVGSAHPYHLSNTAYFDMCMGWRGVCLEPNPRLKHIIRGVRTCGVVDACAWANETTMKFAQGLELAARTTEDLKPSMPGEHPSDLTPSETFFEARCAPLHQLLMEGLVKVLEDDEIQDIVDGRKVPRIDLLSVDAEGAELEIFKVFPFEVWDIRCLVVETSRRTSMAIDSLLLPAGFVKVAVLGKDAVYVSRAQLASLPERLKLPETIMWNEPGSDSDTIEYRRFQRLFGVDGDLDLDVGDQRLLNETELERQAERQEAKEKARMRASLKLATSAYVGGVLSEKQKLLLEDEAVQELLEDAQVKRALILMHQDYPLFFSELRASPRLQIYMKQLIDLGMVIHDEVEEFLNKGIDPEVKRYSSADVARELQRGQDFYRKDALGSDFLALDNSQQEQHYLASMRNSVAHPDFLPMGGQHQPAPEAYGEQCLCGNFYTEDSAFCRKCGRRRAASQSPSPAATAAANAAANAAIRASLTSQDMGTPFDTSSMLSPQELQRLYQDASDVQIKDGHMVSSKVIDKQESRKSSCHQIPAQSGPLSKKRCHIAAARVVFA
ncbi:unnamed protein product [Effrenium voratum]|uniref:Methyltransferase FkbM domain-containing protein n=1 Tax=Effrenium voratum TaxID=2562239 RepID=A0AA36MR03_9DINO|nr:unnamed protein product [Effrenium voratum]